MQCSSLALETQFHPRVDGQDTMGKKRKGAGKKKMAVARILSASDSDIEDEPRPKLPSPRLTSPGCTCFQNISLNKGKYVPKTCALHTPLEFSENRPTIYERIEELQERHRQERAARKAESDDDDDYDVEVVYTRE